jgi:gliding motility-associatede transport system auxiliary component
MTFLPAAGLVMILVGVASYYATRSLHGMSAFSGVNVALGLLLLLVGAIAHARRFRGFSGAESRRVVLRWTGILVGSLLLVVGLDVFARSLTARIDLTVDRLYTLSDESVSLCRELEQKGNGPVELVFFEDALLAKDVKLLVDAYGDACPAVEVRDASRREPPQAARDIYTTTATTVIACRGDQCDPVGYPSERNITSALARFTRERAIRVYFTIGHGEIDLASESDTGYSGIAAMLRDQGFDPQAFVGPASKDVPDDCSVLVVAAPERDLLPEELAVLDRYLARGGRMLVLADAGQRSNVYRDFLPRWGFQLDDAVVLDRASSPLLKDPKAINLLVHQFAPYNPVTRNLSQRTMLLFPRARPVELGRKPEPDDKLDRAAFASPRAWRTNDVAAALSGVETPPPASSDTQEISLVATGRYPRGGSDEDSTSEARVVVIGNRDFASNRLLEALYNRDLFLNAVRWLGNDEHRIALSDKAWTPNQDPLTLQQTVAYFYFLAFALPEALLLLGIFAWWRQRA